MKIDILTLFPAMFHGPFDESIVKRAQTLGLVDIRIHNIRNYATDKHKTVDDTPYGGGAGMVMKVDVIVSALEDILGRSLPSHKTNEKILFLTPKGPSFTQQMAKDLAKLDRITLIAGHYEDIDARITHFIDGTLSIGDYVLTGGELPAMVVCDAVVRLLPQVITPESLVDESFSQANIIEYPQYTKPQTFRNLNVPEELLSGNHKRITTWQQSHQKKKN